MQPLMVDEDQVLMLSIGSSIQYKLVNGVRPWVLDNQLYTFTGW